jgi:hypothetical protein
MNRDFDVWALCRRNADCVDWHIPAKIKLSVRESRRATQPYTVRRARDCDEVVSI